MDAIARKLGDADAPEDGPANTRLADCAASVTTKVPLSVIGLPARFRIEGTVMATDTTEPVPVPAPIAVRNAAEVEALHVVCTKALADLRSCPLPNAV